MIRKFKAYKRMHVTTASPGELVVMLYDGMIRFTRTAKRAIGARMFADAGQSIDRALAIVGYLQGTLDESASPELIHSLDQTYLLWMRGLVRANLDKDVEALEEYAQQMEQLRDGWREACRLAAPRFAEGA